MFDTESTIYSPNDIYSPLENNSQDYLYNQHDPPVNGYQADPFDLNARYVVTVMGRSFPHFMVHL